MASPGKKPFLLRLDPSVLEALQRWADDDVRSLNAHIDFLLRESLRKAGRKPSKTKSNSSSNDPSNSGETL